MNHRWMWPSSSVVVILSTFSIAARSQTSGGASSPASPGAGSPGAAVVPNVPGGSPHSGSTAGSSGASAPGGVVAGGAVGASGGMSGGTSVGSGTTTGASATPGTNIALPPFGWPTNPTQLNTHLPSSSRPTADISRPTDGFDLNRAQAPGNVMRGPENGSMAVPSTSMALPGIHVVKQGDTLWDVCDHYFHSPWEWPRVWSYNPELQNPHWIYPGNHVRLRPPGAEPNADHRMISTPTGIGKGIGRSSAVPQNTVFLRDQGYLDDEATDVWGEVGGSPEDQLLLSDGDYAYIEIAPGHDPVPGQELSVFRPIPRIAGEKGTMVSILGTAKVERWDPKTRVARARLTESLNIIERGAKVGPVSRRFQIVPPARNEVELAAQIVASFYPHVLYGQNQLVFINRGSKDGLVPGNRLFATSHGDGYRGTLATASPLASVRVEYQGDKPARIIEGGARGTENDEAFPTEVIGEVRVLTVRDHTAACLVTGSRRELERGQTLLARKGY